MTVAEQIARLRYRVWCDGNLASNGCPHLVNTENAWRLEELELQHLVPALEIEIKELVRQMHQASFDRLVQGIEERKGLRLGGGEF